LYYYSIAQWLLFFFIYCFIGWIWECCYVSVRTHEWVNRGFLHGPFLPIYGSVAIVILESTIGVKDNFILVYIFGMLAATVLELCTGASMEKLFGVRYWDYSRLPLNFKGHICFFISLGWGAFSVLMVCFAHKPIESLVIRIPTMVADAIAFAITIYMTVDFTISVNEALDFKAMLKRFTEENEQFKTYSRRAEIVATFAEEELQKRKEQFMASVAKESKQIASIIKRNPTLASISYKESVAEFKRFVLKRGKNTEETIGKDNNV